MSKRIINKLRKIYHKNRLTLVLGSGVSKAAGLPLWPDLVKELYNELISTKFGISDINWDVLDLKKDDIILQARYIKNGYGSQEEFYKAIKRALYSKDINLKNEIITSIAKIAMPTRTNHLKSIIVYNFDDLLERKLDEYNLSYKSIYNSDILYENDELPIYHVHGFLPENLNDFDNVDIIFSDDDYNKQTSTELFSWSNIIQLTNFKDSCNLFIGVSFNDSNLRRILEIVKNNFSHVVNYTIQKRSFDSKKHPSDMKEVFEINDKLKEEVLKDLGIEIIWIDDYSEIPSILNSIKK
jgi:hypothetical protein